MPKLLEEIYHLQDELTDVDTRAQLLLKMCANLLESHYHVRKPRNRFTFEEYDSLPGRWEMLDGMIRGLD